MHLPENAPITSCLVVLLASIERSPITAFLLGILLAFICGALGWYLHGLWAPIYDNRGWAALLLFAVIGAALAVRHGSEVQ